MYQTHKTYIRPDMKVSDLINENQTLLLFLEHLRIDFNVGDYTVAEVCKKNALSLNAFIGIGNLYNGFFPEKERQFLKEDIPTIINYLKNSHDFYKHDKYPEIVGLLKKLYSEHQTKDILLIEKFFNDYFEEVLEHLDYEDKVAFPHFCSLLEQGNKENDSKFSAKEYREHHTDIETKLSDLKNLLLKHIQIENDLPLRRKFMYSLFELEFDLKTHSMVEELILLPIIDGIERGDHG